MRPMRGGAWGLFSATLHGEGTTIAMTLKPALCAIAAARRDWRVLRARVFRRDQNFRDPAHGMGRCETGGEAREGRAAEGHANGARPGLVELEQDALEWLKVFSKEPGGVPRVGPLVPPPRAITDWKRANFVPEGIGWDGGCHRNAMRHAYATMHVAAFRNPPATALNMGHGRSPAVLERHYMGLAAKKKAEAYWKIVPGKTLRRNNASDRMRP